MLHTETVKGTTLELLRSLENEELLSSFNLAGGTALSLYLGHRISIDLDLFSPILFEPDELRAHLESHYGFRTSFMRGHTLKGVISGVKVDCLAYDYPYINPPFKDDGIRLYDIADIIAMKLSAVTDNGTRLKDFIDIACLSTRYSFSSMLGFYLQKFPNVNVMRPFKSITYFEDIDFNEDIVMLNGGFEWRLVEERLLEMSVNQDKIFENFPLLGLK